MKVTVSRNLVCVDETAEIAAGYNAGDAIDDSDAEDNVDSADQPTFGSSFSHIRSLSFQNGSDAVLHGSDLVTSSPTLPAPSSWQNPASSNQGYSQSTFHLTGEINIDKPDDHAWDSSTSTLLVSTDLYNQTPSLSSFRILKVPFISSPSNGSSGADGLSAFTSHPRPLPPAPSSSASYQTRGPFHDPARKPAWTSNLPEAVLMRFFIHELAHWYDICDPERHFQLVVPQRARDCPPLLNAIFTASALALTRLAKFKTRVTIDGTEREVVTYAGKTLPDLQLESAIRYHSESIKDLIQLGNDPNQVHNVDLLAAAIILRHHEEVSLQMPLSSSNRSPPSDDMRGDAVDSELFLKVTSLFLSAQQPTVTRLPHTSPVTFQSTPIPYDTIDSTTYFEMQSSDSPLASHTVPPPQHHHSTSITSNDPVPRILRADGLRQASLWVAFRQEIVMAFLKQRPFQLPLSRCSAFRTFEPAEDAVWADRLIVFCADVLYFCYGGADRETNETTASLARPSSDGSSTASAPPYRNNSRQEERTRWNELQSTLQQFSAMLPKSFEPIYFRRPDPENLNSIFPEIWYLDAINVAGIQHLELARILLVSYNPDCPKLGPGYLAAMTKLSADLKSIVLRLCGIATSNRHTPPGMVTASMAIAMCGEHFQVSQEQEALMGILWELEREHAWPTDQIRMSLSRAWRWAEKSINRT